MATRPTVKNSKSISRSERRDIRRRYQLGGFLEYDGLPGWQECEIRPQMLRIVHGDFRGEPLLKGELIDAYVRRVRDRIDSSDFPFSDEIRQKWPNKPPVYVLRTRSNQELYVYDGQKRTLNACYNADEWITALLVDVDEDRDVL